LPPNRLVALATINPWDTPAPSLKIGKQMTAQKPGLHPRNKNAGGYDFAALTPVAPGWSST
jgi:hypothetical protein